MADSTRERGLQGRKSGEMAVDSFPTHTRLDSRPTPPPTPPTPRHDSNSQTGLLGAIWTNLLGQRRQSGKKRARGRGCVRTGLRSLARVSSPDLSIMLTAETEAGTGATGAWKPRAATERESMVRVNESFGSFGTSGEK